MIVIQIQVSRKKRHIRFKKEITQMTHVLGHHHLSMITLGKENYASTGKTQASLFHLLMMKISLFLPHIYR